MRVLINYLYQYYPYTTASYLEMVLRADKRIETFRIGENRIPCADLIINVEPCEMIIAYPGRKSCFWEIDNHIHQGHDVDKYEKVDHVFVTQKAFLNLYPSSKTSWLPLAADPELHKLYPEEPLEYDVGFLGNDTYPERRRLLELIGANYKLLRSTSKPGEEYSRLLSRCKILFNRSMDNDLNMRVFEAISIGRLLLSDKVAGQDELLKDGAHYVSYADWQGLDEAIKYYLSHDKEREALASAGAAWIRAKHTYQHRLETILETMGFY
jgi:glycosyltransferase involved in cell wall biosynthesis